MSERDFDQAKAEAFGGKMVGILNGGALALMTSLGHRTGLFDAMVRIPPGDSTAIAKAAKLDERYVREWLGAMVTGGFVEYEVAAGTYRLPPEHAASLTRAARPDNLAVTAQWIPVLAGVEDKIVACFERGGGVPYSEFPRFHQVMAEESDQTVVALLVDVILPILPGGISSLEEGIDVVDIGCGSGRALVEMAGRFPKSRFSGYDISQEGNAVANAMAKEKGLSNLSFEVRDIADLDDSNAFDLVTAFDVIHDQAKPAAVLDAVASILRPEGTFLMQDIAGTSHLERDIDHPIGSLLYTVSCMHCMTVSLAAGGEGLGAMWGEETARRMLGEAGFDSVDVVSLPHDASSHFYVARKLA